MLFRQYYINALERIPIITIKSKYKIPKLMSGYFLPQTKEELKQFKYGDNKAYIPIWFLLPPHHPQAFNVTPFQRQCLFMREEIGVIKKANRKILSFIDCPLHHNPMDYLNDKTIVSFLSNEHIPSFSKIYVESVISKFRNYFNQCWSFNTKSTSSHNLGLTTEIIRKIECFKISTLFPIFNNGVDGVVTNIFISNAIPALKVLPNELTEQFVSFTIKSFVWTQNSKTKLVFDGASVNNIGHPIKNYYDYLNNNLVYREEKLCVE